jgi:hypothetical protein
VTRMDAVAIFAITALLTAAIVIVFAGGCA